MTEIRSFQPVPPICRALRPAAIEAVIANNADVKRTIEARLIAPDGVRIVRPKAAVKMTVDDAWEHKATWIVEAARQGEYTFVCIADGQRASLTVRFEAPVTVRKAAYVPEPKPVKTDMLVGAHNCPLWEADKPFMWANVLKHPERTPALGFYA
ncbi:MAG: hypothetical protein FJX72_17545, partial [Armatimonadetes bacterium]|nr:hypothetical protein [Armatimonadota bacterium]